MLVYLKPELGTCEAKPFDDMISTVLMLADPLLAFDEELSFETLVDTLLTEDNDELVAELLKSSQIQALSLSFRILQARFHLQ